MSETTTAARRNSSLLVRGAEPADHEAIRGVVLGAYAQYAGQLAPEVFSRYLAGQLDLGTNASYGRLLVAGTEDGVRGFAAFYPDASVADSVWPPGWASGRALAVHPDARGNGAARALLATGEYLAIQAGAPVFAFNTHSYMTGAIALYERLGYRRAPKFDVDLAARFGGPGAAPIMAFAYIRHLTRHT